MTKENSRQYLEELIFSEFRCIVSDRDETKQTNESLTAAITVNENINSLGYTLWPLDIINVLATIKNPKAVYDKIHSFVPEITTEPMYPDFPKQVMLMDEAQYRMHQLMHYASTYGMESYGTLMNTLCGIEENAEITTGWLPAVKKTEKTDEDVSLLNLKVLTVLTENEIYSYPFKKILGRRERMSVKDTEIIALICAQAPQTVIDILPIEIPFKENLVSLVNILITLEDRNVGTKIMSQLCKHTGDVLKCLQARLSTTHFHLSRPEKRQWVRLIETYYTATDFACNLMLSNRKAEKNITLLQFVDYNGYSKSEAHREAVRQLRNRELSSWEGSLKKALHQDLSKGLEIAATRPGNLLRMLTWFIRMGMSPADIEKALLSAATDLSLQTLVDVMNKFSNEWAQGYDENGKPCVGIDQRREEEQQVAAKIVRKAIQAKLASLETPLSNPITLNGEAVPCKVYVNPSVYDLPQSKMIGTGKTVEGGYLRAGLAFKLPEDFKTLRFFTYWNDEHRIDIDLHAFAFADNHQTHIGWNGEFAKNGMCTSGDITHSDAAEYIDVDLKKATEASVDRVDLFVNVYYGACDFGHIDTCFSGIQAVSNLDENIKLYSPKNCLFSFENTAHCETEKIGTVYPKERLFELSTAKINKELYQYGENLPTSIRHKIEYSIMDYLNDLIVAQGAELTESAEEADIVLTVEKAENDKEISLIDTNFFLDNKQKEKRV